MTRNLDRRIETLMLIENPMMHRQVLDQIMIANLQGQTDSRELMPTSDYRRLASDEEVMAIS